VVDSQEVYAVLLWPPHKIWLLCIKSCLYQTMYQTTGGLRNFGASEPHPLD